MKRAFGATLVVSCALSACNLSALFVPRSDAGIDGGAAITFDSGAAFDAGPSPLETCAWLNSARCEAQARCGLISDTAASRAECQRAWEATWCGPSTWPSHVAAGALRLDHARVTQCLTDLGTRSCDKWATLPEACQHFLLPRVPLGQPCFDGYDECLNDGVCGGATCPRTCQARGESGARCLTDDECRAGLLCRQPLVPTGAGTCLAQSGLGGSCVGDVDCQSGLFCHELKCAGLPLAGTQCLAGRCLSDSYCDAGLCHVRKALSAPCIGDECQASLVCSRSQGSCVVAVVAINETCAPPQRCVTGATCLSLTSTCAVPRDEGEPCGVPADCQAHLTCRSGDGGVGLCVRRLPETSGCAASVDCQVSAMCEGADAGACVELPLPGEPCGVSRQCRWGLCRDTVDGGAVCGPLLSAGATCGSNTECASGSCVANTCTARCVP